MRNYFADISGSRRPETTLHSGTLGLVKSGERVRLVLSIEEWNSFTSFQEEDSRVLLQLSLPTTGVNR
jgi:hypothetical protein